MSRVVSFGPPPQPRTPAGRASRCFPQVDPCPLRTPFDEEKTLMSRRHSIPALVLATLAGVMSHAPATATVPPQFMVQGVLRDNAGVPENGAFPMTFRLFDVATGGTALWEEIHSSVAV